MKVNKNCVGCGQCAAFCIVDAIDIKGKAIITCTCTDCRKCIPYCPVKALEA